MKIAVVIPALREADRIEAAVASAKAPDVEVVVVDGGSEDGTPEKAERAGARVLRGAAGRARQQNLGVARTVSDALLFLHADTRLPTGWDRRVRGALRDPAVAGGAFGFQFEQRSLRLRWIEWGVGLRLRLFALPYGDQGIFVRRSILAEIGGVPEAPIMEDLDLVRAIKQRGRFVLLEAPVTTSARRYQRLGPVRTFVRNAGALLAWRLSLDRARVARWYHS